MRFGSRARGGSRVRGTSVLPTLTGDVKTTGRFWTTSLGTPAAPAYAMGVLGNDGVLSGGASNVQLAANGAWVIGAGNPGSTVSILGLLTCGSGITLAVGDLTMPAGGQIFADLGTSSEPGYSFSGDPNTGVYSNGADGVAVATGSNVPIFWGGTGTNVLGVLACSSYIEIGQIAAPGVASNTKVRLYALDAAGKTRLANIFDSGAQFTINTEV